MQNWSFIPSKVFRLSGQIQNSFTRPAKPLMVWPSLPMSPSCSILHRAFAHAVSSAFPLHVTMATPPHPTDLTFSIMFSELPLTTTHRLQLLTCLSFRHCHICNFIFLVLCPYCLLCSVRGRTVSAFLTILFPGPDKVAVHRHQIFLEWMKK